MSNNGKNYYLSGMAKEKQIELLTKVKFFDIDANKERSAGEKFKVSKERAEVLQKAKDRKGRLLVEVSVIEKSK